MLKYYKTWRELIEGQTNIYNHAYLVSSQQFLVQNHKQSIYTCGVTINNHFVHNLSYIWIRQVSYCYNAGMDNLKRGLISLQLLEAVAGYVIFSALDKEYFAPDTSCNSTALDRD